MPKELAHRHIASSAASLLGGVVAPEDPYFALGALLYDSPFYAVGLPKRDAIEQTARELHGVDGEDTLERYRRMRSEGRFDPKGPQASFLSGALTHYAADVTIHPFVNYFCNGSPTSERRHRAFETCIDLVVCSRAGTTPRGEGGMHVLLDRVDLPLLASIAARFYRDDGAIDDELAAAMVRRHAAIRDRFTSPLLRSAASALGALGIDSAKTLAATFYPSRARTARMLGELERFFDGPIEYRHPRTGAHHRVTLDRLLDEAARFAASLITSFTAGALPEEPGLSLDAGCDVREFPDERYTATAEPVARVSRFYRE